MKKIIALLLVVLAQNVFSQTEKTADSLKTTELKAVEVVAKKKAIEQKADRTVFDFSEQSHLNSGSTMEGLKKLPGLIVSDIAGMMYQGKQLEVYMDGRPLNIFSNELNAFLESMPANSVEKIEIVTQPGAEFPATSGGAILNIITSKNAKKYLTASYSNGYSFTKYTNARHRFNNSVLLSAKNNLFGWQIQLGQNYNNAYQRTNFSNSNVVLSKNITDRINRYYFVKSGLKFDFGKDRLLLNYDVSTSNNNADVEAEGFGFQTADRSKTKFNRNDVLLHYQKRFDAPDKKLDFILNYNVNSNDFGLNSVLNGNSVLNNTSNQAFLQFKTDYSQELKWFDKTKFSTGILADELQFDTKSFGVQNLDYSRTTLAAYTEVQTTVKKIDFILGGRLESYSIEGKTDTGNITPFKQTRFFPNAAIQYNLIPQVYASINYNKKISLPNTSALNPNNTSYQNPNVAFFGNPNLNPTIFDNYEAKISAFDYFFVGYSRSDAHNQVINRIITTPTGAASVSQNLKNVRIENFNFGLPIPYMIFTKNIKEIMKFDFNPDEINFLYIYVGKQQHTIPELEKKGFWVFNLMSQIVLPSKIKFTANYGTTSTGGNYYYYGIQEPFNQELDFTLSKKFLDNNLSVSIYANDILNTNKQGLTAIGTDLLFTSKSDTRRVGFSLNYKIPTKNKLAKIETDLLNKDKKEDTPAIGN